MFAGEFQSLFPVRSLDDAVVGREDVAQEEAQLVVVLHHEEGQAFAVSVVFRFPVSLVSVLRRGGSRAVVENEFRVLIVFISGAAEREGDSEAASLADLAFHVNLSVVQADHLPCHGESDARGGMHHVAVREVLEAVEEHLAVLFVDADAPVSHRDAHGTVGKGYFDADGLPVRCVLEGIGEEVEEDLFHLVRIEPHREAVHRRGEGEGDVLGFRHGAEVEHHLPEQCDEVGFLDDELHLAVLQFAEVENLVHHAQHSSGVGADE